jgi:CO/xanthine dehydrogenase Mo-binding subunit
VLLAGHAALAAYLAEKPVKLVATLSENRRFGPRRFPAAIQYRTALDAGGNLLALEAEVTLETGAYPIMGPQALMRTVLAATGAYACSNVKITARLLHSNRCPFYGSAGYGEPQGSFGLECHTNRIAETAQMNPHIWKKQNLLKSGAMLSPGSQLSTREEACRVLDDVVQRSDFERKYAAYEAAKKRRESLWDQATPLRGIGIALTPHGIGSFPGQDEEDPCRFKTIFDTNKKLHCLSSFVGDERLWHYRKIAANIMEIPESDIIIPTVDTAAAPNSGSSVGSRPVHLGTPLLEKCCESIKKKRIRSILPIEAARSTRSAAGSQWDPRSFRGEPYAATSWEATVVEVEIDPVSLKPRWKKIWLTLFIGYQDSIEESKVEAAAVSEMAWAALHAPAPGEKQPWGNAGTHPSFSIQEIPPIEVALLPPLSRNAVRKGYGDTPVLGVAPAFANAVSQAAGLQTDSLPITPEGIDKALS